MDNSTDVDHGGVYQPSWLSCYLLKEFPEIQNWNPDLEELILTESNDEKSLCKEKIISRALDHLQSIDRIRREEIPVGHLEYLRTLVSSLQSGRFSKVTRL